MQLESIHVSKENLINSQEALLFKFIWRWTTILKVKL